MAVAGARSVAAAASAKNVSQPSVSAAIIKMEELLGVTLFVRHHAQGVSLTLAGQRLLPKARDMIAQFHDFEIQAHSAAEEAIGSLKIGCYATLAPMFMPALIDRTRRDYQKIQLEFVEGTEDQLPLMLAQGEIDMAICYDNALPDGINKIHLKQTHPYLLLPADHPKAGQKEVSLAEVAGEPFVLLDTAPGRDYFLGLFKDMSLEPNITYRSQSFEVVRGLVSRGVGYTILVTRPHSDLTYDGRSIVHIPLPGNVRSAGICLIRMPTVRTTKVFSVFQEMCKSIAGEIPQP